MKPHTLQAIHRSLAHGGGTFYPTVVSNNIHPSAHGRTHNNFVDSYHSLCIVYTILCTHNSIHAPNNLQFFPTVRHNGTKINSRIDIVHIVTERQQSIVVAQRINKLHGFPPKGLIARHRPRVQILPLIHFWPGAVGKRTAKARTRASSKKLGHMGNSILQNKTNILDLFSNYSQFILNLFLIYS